MSQIESAVSAYNAAVERMNKAADAIEAAADDVTDEQIAELRAEFDAAEKEFEVRADEQKLAERVEARKATPLLETPEKPEEKREKIEVKKEELTYRQGGEQSFLRDMVRATMPGQVPDMQAVARLQRHKQEIAVEQRVNPNSTDGQGGEFVPPIWLQEEYVALAKAGRVTADACRSTPLPAGTDTINFPTVATGATTATQADAGSVSSTDITTSSYSVGVKTIAGQQDLSLQLYDRSVPNIDQVVFEELTGRYAINLDTQVLAGGGSGANAQGIDGLSGINTTAYTDGSPTVAEFYSSLANAVQKVHTTRFLPPTAIIMHPRRWAWILAAGDTTGRPLVVPNGDAFNQSAVLSDVAPEGVVGGMQGLPVLVDPNIGTTFGASTNEDRVYVCRLQDLWLMEDSPVKTRVLFEILSGTLQVRVQLYNYFAFAAGRYPKSISAITGTGLVAPTF